MRSADVRALARRLKAIPGRMLSRGERAAVMAAEHAAQTARELVPVDTGELRNSISHSPDVRGAVVRAEAGHAAMVEYGTEKMPPRPFMLPAARAAAETFFKSAGEDKT